MRKNYRKRINKAWMQIYYKEIRGIDLPRRMKKALFGKRIGSAKLKKMINKLEFIKIPKTIHEDYEIRGVAELFCPECGCTSRIDIEHAVSYPEMWIESYCARCTSFVGAIDNSPFCHILLEIKRESY